MAVFGKTGFIRKQEIAFAKKLLIWKYENSGTVLPDEAVLSRHAEQVVDDAHIIAKKSGSNLIDIIKDSIKNIRNKKNP